MTSCAKPNSREELKSVDSGVTSRSGRKRKPVPAAQNNTVTPFPVRSDRERWEHKHPDKPERKLNWQFANERSALGRAMLDVIHQQSIPGGMVATSSTALAYQTQTKPFFLWLNQTTEDHRGKLPGKDDLIIQPELIEEFRNAMDLRVALGEIAGTTRYAYKASALRILRHMYLTDHTVFGPGWLDEDFVHGDRIDDTVPNAPYSLAEAQRIIDHCSSLIAKLYESDRWHDQTIVEAAAYTIIGLKLGIEPECLAQLTLANVIMDGKRMKVRYVKRRGGGGNGFTKYRLSDPTEAEIEEIVATGTTFREAAGVLALLRNNARARNGHRKQEAEKLALFNFTCNAPTFTFFSNHLYQNGLRGDNGKLLSILRPRLRPTWRTQRTIKHGGRLSIDRSDNSSNVRAKHYLDNDQIRPFLENAILDAQAEAWQHALVPRVIDLPADASEGDKQEAAQKIANTEKVVSKALSGEQDVWLASCKDFTNSPFDKPGTPCTKSFFGCVLCPNAPITRRTLPAILGFKAHVEKRRAEMGSEEWETMFGASWREITTTILPQFDASSIADARTIARGLDMHLPPELIQ